MEDQDLKRKELLAAVKVIAIVGLSPKEDRPSNRVARYLRDAGYRIIPVNPQHDQILGEKSYKTLGDIPEKIDVVDIFMRPEGVVPIVEEAVKLRPKAIWLQLGVINDAAKAIAEKEGIPFIQDRCIKIEHGRLLASR